MIDLRGMAQRGGRAACAALLALAVSGCESDRGSVSGKVTYRRHPLGGGTVLFYGPDQSVTASLIAADGTYRAPNLPVGRVRVAVVPHPPVPPGLSRANREAPPAARAPPVPSDSTSVSGPEVRAVRIPEKYSHPERSGLSLQVDRAEQTFDIELQAEKPR
jgi:hypothetical protein